MLLQVLHLHLAQHAQLVPSGVAQVLRTSVSSGRAEPGRGSNQPPKFLHADCDNNKQLESHVALQLETILKLQKLSCQGLGI